MFSANPGVVTAFMMSIGLTSAEVWLTCCSQVQRQDLQVFTFLQQTTITARTGIMIDAIPVIIMYVDSLMRNVGLEFLIMVMKK